MSDGVMVLLIVFSCTKKLWPHHISSHNSLWQSLHGLFHKEEKQYLSNSVLEWTHLCLVERALFHAKWDYMEILGLTLI